MDVYMRVAGVGSTIDNLREYLMVLYAKAYDAIDRHFILGGEIEYKHSPQEVARVSQHFDRLIKIAKMGGDKKAEKLLRQLKSSTIKHMQGKLSAKQFVKVLRKIMRDYGIPSAEIKKIEDRINRIEAEIKAKEASMRQRQSGSVFGALDNFATKLYGGGKRATPKTAAPTRQANPLAALDAFTAKLYGGARKKPTPPHAARAPARRPVNPFAALDAWFERMVKPRRRRK